MQKGKVINIVLLVIVIALLVAAAMFVRIRPTADSVAVLSTAGMTCDRCGSTLERALQARKGVAGVEVDVKGGRVVVGYDSKKTGPELLASTATEAGYRSSVAGMMSAEKFRAMTGRSPEELSGKAGCGCCAGR
jgi:copper chaperone CopZ